MIAAVCDGISVTNANFSAVSTSCPTGNCTFPNYTSLGICASVRNVSNHLVEVPYTSPCFNTTNGPCFNYTLPGQGDHNISFSDSCGIDYGNTTFMQASPSNGLIGHLDFPGITLINFILFYQSLSITSLDNGTPVFTKGPVVVMECKLEFCAHTYANTVDATATNTILNRTDFFEYSPSINPENITGMFDGVDLGVNGDVFANNWHSLTGSFTGKCGSPTWEFEGLGNGALGCVSETSDSNSILISLF